MTLWQRLYGLYLNFPGDLIAAVKRGIKRRQDSPYWENRPVFVWCDGRWRFGHVREVNETDGLVRVDALEGRSIRSGWYLPLEIRPC